METLGENRVLETLLFLLPGFVTAGIVGALTVREDSSTFDRLVQALIYTLLSHLLWTPFSLWLLPTPGVHLLGLGACAVVWGILLTWIINAGKVHDLLRNRLKLTRATSRPSEWYDAFYRREWHVILHLADGRRIMGWPKLYAQRSDKGHIFLTGAKWLDRPEDAPASGRVDFLIPVTDVRFVEFVSPKKEEPEDG